MLFSEKVKSLRIDKRLTLRAFCSQVGLDPSNWSKVERGINPPPSDIGLLEQLADFFGLQGNAKLEFMDAAALQRHEIPADIAKSGILRKALPAFFRAARGHELSAEELENLAKDIQNLHTSNHQDG